MNNKEFINKIRRDYNIPSNFILKILAKYFQKDISDIYFNTYELSKKDIELLNKVIFEDYPIEYTIKKAKFLGNEFYVDENVLIPRTETEDIVLLAEKIIKKNNFKNILDLATGSGVIAISLKKRNNNLNIIGSDISVKALDIAKKNSKIHNTKIEFYQSDILKNIKNKIKNVDFIISNPPYVEEKEEYLNSSIKYEPKNALFAGKDGQNFFRELINYKKLLKNKTLLFETTEFNYDKTLNILSELGETQTYIDSFGKRRFILVIS